MAAAGQVRTHWLRPNHKDWTPPQFISFDAETTAEQTDAGEVHRPRLWAARLDVRRAKRDTQLGAETNWGHTPAQLAEQITEWCRGQNTMWAYAHNLSFDLAATRLPIALMDLGWRVTDHAVGSDTPWLRMRRGECVLTMADSWGWLRAPIEAVGADVGVSKPPLPDWDDSDDAWIKRCSADVEILAAAMRTLMDWWDAEKLGCWSLTGSSAGWNAMRHKMPAESILMVHGADQVEADRRAIYGGRRDAFRHGHLERGPFALLDFWRAYTVICRDKPLPVRRRGNFPGLPIDSLLVSSDRYGIIAEVEVETDIPRWPVRAGGRVAYPVGRFTTVMASPEIAEARRLGCLRSIGPGFLHELGTPLAPWATWCLGAQDAPDDVVPAVAKRALKHWGRAVVGKFGQHGYEKIPAGPATHGGWWYEPCYNHERQQRGHLVEVGDRQVETVQTPVGENSYPAVLAFVESWTRVYLTRALEAIGLQHVISCDTDGLITAGGDTWRAAVAAADLGPLTLRHKSSYRQITVLGPQHYIAPGDRKLAGIPRKAQQLPDGRLRAQLWPKLAWQMEHAPPDGYLRPTQHYRLAASYVTGWVLAGGRVRPLEARLCPAGHTHILAWASTRWAAAGDQLGGDQAADVIRITTPPTPEEEQCKYPSSRPNGTATGRDQSPSIACCTSNLSLIGRVAARVRRWLRRGKTPGT